MGLMGVLVGLVLGKAGLDDLISLARFLCGPAFSCILHVLVLG